MIKLTKPLAIALGLVLISVLSLSLAYAYKTSLNPVIKPESTESLNQGLKTPYSSFINPKGILLGIILVSAAIIGLIVYKNAIIAPFAKTPRLSVSMEMPKTVEVKLKQVTDQVDGLKILFKVCIAAIVILSIIRHFNNLLNFAEIKRAETQRYQRSDEERNLPGQGIARSNLDEGSWSITQFPEIPASAYGGLDLRLESQTYYNQSAAPASKPGD